jgi:hypothetical protein
MATVTAPPNPIELVQPDDSAYWVEMVKCRHACPVHTDACGYVNAIAEGRYEDAYRIIRATNPFASICGRVKCCNSTAPPVFDAPPSSQPLPSRCA